MTGDAFRRHLARIAKEYKLSVNTYERAFKLSGVPRSAFVAIELRENTSIGHVLRLLDAAGYELEIKRKDERQ